MSKLDLPEFPEVDRARFRSAIARLIDQQARDAAAPSVGPRSLTGRLPKLSAAADDAPPESAEDAGAARHFLAMLEAAYLVAAADGLGEAERGALGELIAQVTGDPKGGAALATLFARFNEGLERDGIPARLAEVASCFEDFMAREEALNFVTLIALADGSISRREARSLIELAERLGYSMGELQALLDSVTSSLKRELAAAG